VLRIELLQIDKRSCSFRSMNM